MVLVKQLVPSLHKARSICASWFVAISPWKDDMLADPSRQIWFEEIPSSLGAVCSVGQPKERETVTFETSSERTDGTQTDPL
jgi:hypothetical protein